MPTLIPNSVKCFRIEFILFKVAAILVLNFMNICYVVKVILIAEICVVRCNVDAAKKPSDFSLCAVQSR